MQNLFSYPLVVEELTAETRHYKLKANTEELNYITEVLKVVDSKVFEAEMDVKLFKKEHRLEVRGKVKADLVQTSVISLEDFVKNYKTDFELIYDTKLTPQEVKEMEIDLEDEVPDLILDGKIDLAEIAMEQIALIIDDFPRQKGETFKFESEFDEETTEAMNPFAALAKLKK